MITDRGFSTAVERSILTLAIAGHSTSHIASHTAQHPRRVGEYLAETSPSGHVDDYRATLKALTDPAPAQALSGTEQRELRRVPLGDLHPDPDNLRTDLGDIEGLASSIDEAGLLQPIVARRRGRRLIIVAGHRRYAAVRSLGWTDVEVVISREMQPAEVLAAMLIENGQRAGLDPIEEAHGLNRLKLQQDLSSLEVGAIVGRSHKWVDSRLALLDLPLDLQDKVRAGELGVGAARNHAIAITGKSRPGSGPTHYLTGLHPLASRARAVCKQEHPKGAHLIGSTACGKCWESVIAAHARRGLVDEAAREGQCPTCGSCDLQVPPSLTEGGA